MRFNSFLAIGTMALVGFVFLERCSKAIINAGSFRVAFNDQMPKYSVTPVGNAGCCVLFSAGVRIGNEADIARKLVERPKPVDRTQFHEELHGGEGADPHDGS